MLARRVLARQGYMAYGKARASVGVWPTTYRYTGQREETGIGLYYYGARWYDPLVGRFLQPDTLVPDPANPQALNRYAYSINNPLRYIDPSGHVWIDASEGAGVYGTGSWAGALASAARTGQEYSNIRALLVTVASVVSEPIDWVTTIYDCATEGCNPAAAAVGVLPLVPGTAIRRLGAESFRAGGRLVQGIDTLANGTIVRKVTTALTDVQKRALRTEARSIYDIVNPGLRSKLGLQIHHRIPLEWAHLFPDVDPNRLANLIGVSGAIHEKINSRWAAFRSALGGRTPTASEVMQYVQRIEREFGQHYD